MRIELATTKVTCQSTTIYATDLSKMIPYLPTSRSHSSYCSCLKKLFMWISHNYLVIMKGNVFSIYKKRII